MFRKLLLIFLFPLLWTVESAPSSVFGAPSGVSRELRVAQLLSGDRAGIYRNYPNALSSLLVSAREETGLPFVADPLVISSFTDPRLSGCPFLYINWDDRSDWGQLGESETLALRRYLEDGGFVFLDAGITASFLREVPGLSQHHSFAEWEATPEVGAFFAKVLPGISFQSVPRTDPLFSCCYQGLPDASRLPPTVKEYTVQEKWPSGTYSAVALRLHGRIAVLAMPVIAMGWGKNRFGGWDTTIRFRTLEGTDRLGAMLDKAAYSGERFQITREDGGKDEVYCQEAALPAWSHEPSGRWRVFRYYDSRQIDDFTHLFYTRLGINILVAALLGL